MSWGDGVSHWGSTSMPLPRSCPRRSKGHRKRGADMALHFSTMELAERRAGGVGGVAARGLDGLLIFRQESMYYLTGYDTFGYVFFQCLYLGADGRMMLLTRAPDLLQAKHTSV